MKSIKTLKIGDRIQAVKYGKNITGEITKKLEGSVVIIKDNNEELEVIDINRIKKNLTQDEN